MRTESELVAEWLGYAYAIADAYYLPDGSFEDIRQEALIGLIEGLRGFDESRGIPLGAFLNLTINRQVWQAVKTSRRFKHRVLSEALRHIDLEGEVVEAWSALEDPLADVQRNLEARTNLRAVLDGLPRLSVYERRAVVGFAVGCSYSEIDHRTKSVDNALQRGRAKLREAA